MKSFLLGSVLLAALPISTAKSSTIVMQVFDGATLLDTVVSTFGSATLTTSDANFSTIHLDASGPPFLPNADLTSTTLDATATGGTHVLTADIFQTGVKGCCSTESTFSVNNLVGTPGPTTEATFLNGTTSALGTPLANHTFPAGTIIETAGPIALPAGSIFADAMQYKITFTAADQSATDTIQLTTGIPEASTWVMVGLGFAGLAFAASRKRQAQLAVG